MSTSMRYDGRRIGLEGAVDHDAISKHVEIVIPLAGPARSRCALEDEVVLFHVYLAVIPTSSCPSPLPPRASRRVRVLHLLAWAAASAERP
jgi:hypothetical protein